MNAKIKTLLVTGVGVALGFIFYKVVSKVLADQGVFTGEETLMASGFFRPPAPTEKPCWWKPATSVTLRDKMRCAKQGRNQSVINNTWYCCKK